MLGPRKPLGGQYVGAGGALVTPEQVAQQKQIAAALLQQAGDTSPVGHWTAALNRGLQGWFGGRDMYRARQAESEGTSKALERFNARNSGASAASRVAEALAGGVSAGQPVSGDESGFLASLVASESGGNWNALNKEGYGGRLQFGAARLADAARAGVIPAAITGAEFSRLSPEQQMAVEQWHFNDIDQQAERMGLGQYVGQTVAGIPITREAIRGMAHLGGIGGAAKFLQSGGRYNPADSNGTSLADYALRHGGAGAGISPAPAASNVSEIAALLADPWLPKDAKAVLQAEMNQQMQMQNAAYEMQLQQQDPMRQIQLQQERLKLDQMLNPVSDYDKRSAVADQFGLQGEARRSFILTGEIPGTPEGFTLGEGQMRFDANGNLIASGGDKTPSLDEYQKYVQEAKDSGQPVLDRLSYEQAKKGKGFSMTLPDGTVVQMGGPQGPGPEFSDTGAFDINTVLSDIDAILASDLARITGPIQGAGGNMVDELAWPQRLLAGEEGLTTIERIGNLQNKTWMAARSMLKGGGSITDYESRKAEGAMARLSRVKSESEMRSALKDLRDAVVEGQRKLAKAKGVNAPSSDAEKPQQAEPEQPKPRRRYNPQTRSFE